MCDGIDMGSEGKATLRKLLKTLVIRVLSEYFALTEHLIGVLK